MLAAVATAAGQSPPSEVYVEIALPGEPALFTYEWMPLGREVVVVDRASRIEDLLRARSIYPDGESLALVYELNPERRVATVSPGSTVTMPVFEHPDSVLDALAQGHVVYVRTYLELKRRLAERIRTLDQQTSTVAELDAALLSSGAGERDRDQFIAALREIEDHGRTVLLAIQNRTRPLGRSYLEQLDSELRFVSEALQSGRLDDATRDAVTDIASVAEARQEYFVDEHGPALEMEAPPKPRFAVEVLDRNRNRKAGMRIYYVAVARRGIEAPNAIVGQTTATGVLLSDPLTVANYYVWGDSPHDAALRTDTLKLELRTPLDGGPYGPLQLALIDP